jgi:hypothetical protein
MDYKREEIEAYFDDYINDIINNQGRQWIEDNQDDLHHYAFNEDYYIIGTYQAKQWLGNMAFEVINFIKEWEQVNFGEVLTDFSDPEKVVNMYTYIIGSEIVSEFLDRLEEVK